MEVEIQKSTTEQVEKLSKLLGLEKQEVIGKAVDFYFENLEKHSKLKKEIKDWDKLSDEALDEFEKAL